MMQPRANRSFTLHEASTTWQQRALALLAEVAPPPHISYAEFLDWADEDTLAEWVEGKIVMTSPASRRHQAVAAFLTALLGGYVEAHGLGSVLPAPFQMKLAQSGREPDVLFVATVHLARLHSNYLNGPADLVVEIVSPESAGRDRGDKFYEYAAGGVPEYWLLDPQAQWVEFYVLAGARYRLAYSGQAGVYHAEAVPGFWLEVAWLWQEPLPRVDELLLEIGGAGYAQHLIARLRQRGYLSD